ncbi:unnamed protein product [Sphagnum balticum]
MTLAVHWTPCYGMRNATLPKATLCCRCKGASMAVRVTKTVTCEGESGESSSGSSSRQSETRKLGFGTKNSKSENRRGHKQGGEADGLNANGKKSAEKRAVAMREGSKQLQNVLRNVDKETAAEQSRKLGIDPQVAAKGKVDFVRVETWAGDGTEAALENLPMKSFSPAFIADEDTAPFYEQLVRRLQLLDSKGEISVAQGRPIPPFERWSFSTNHYIQFLQDQLAVYSVLKDVIAAVKNSKSSGNTGPRSSGDGSSSQAVRAVTLFDTVLGLDRTKELTADIAAVSGAAAADSDLHTPSLEPTTQTTAYVKYIEQVGRNAAAELSTEACLQLLAHIFAIHVAHLTTGMRVGAKAVERLSIVKKSRAVHFYRDYPQQAQDPLRVLIAAVNTAGSYLLPEEREQVMQELANAIQRTSLLFAVLAIEEQLEVTT